MAMERQTLLDCLSEADDPRCESNGALHNLTELLAA